MTGIRGMGALIALEEMGLTDAFDLIFTYSAGFPNAAYFVARESQLAASVYYNNLPREKFVDFLRFWDIANVKILIKILKYEKPLLLSRVLKSKTKIYNRFVKNGNQIEYKEIHKMGKNFWKYLEAATSSPFVSPGKIKIGNAKYKDIGITGSQMQNHLRYAIESDLTDLLVIYCRRDQVEKNRLRSAKIFELIPSPKWKMSRLETNREVLKKNCVAMGTLTKEVFGFKSAIKLEERKYDNINLTISRS